MDPAGLADKQQIKRKPGCIIQSSEEKIDAAAKQWQNVVKKKMFGGVCYLLKGNMAFGIYKDNLIVRMDKERGEQSLKERNVKPFDITGRPMAGWVMIQEAGGRALPAWRNGWKWESASRCRCRRRRGRQGQ